MYKLKLENFEGPLDLLVQLIESADLDITQVALAEVADQFMGYLEQIEEKKPEILADFLVIASKLLLIKSKILLPSLQVDPEDGLDDLEKQLKIYKEFHEASKVIEQILAEKKVLFSRKKVPMDIEVIFNPPKKLDKLKLKRIFLEILKEIEPVIKIPKKSLLRAVSIKEKIENIRTRILKEVNINFADLIKESKNKTDVVVTFLGILELVKQRTVVVKQDDKFGEISVTRLDNKNNE